MRQFQDNFQTSGFVALDLFKDVLFKNFEDRKTNLNTSLQISIGPEGNKLTMLCNFNFQEQDYSLYCW